MAKNTSSQAVSCRAFVFILMQCFVVFITILTNNPASAASTISQGYSTSDKLSVGSIVSLSENTTDTVIASNSSNSENILGVVINQNDSLLSLTSGSGSQVQVVTNGSVKVLASDINGDIAVGDHITASPISGVGMKATSNVRVIGIAQSGLQDSSTETYKDESGTEHSVKVGTVSLLVSVAYYYKEPEKTIIPTAIQNVANALAGRTVSALPIIISAIIFIIMLIIVASIIFSMIRSSLISVGRNPMSQSAIYRDLIQLSALVLVILSVGVTAIYLVLTRM